MCTNHSNILHYQRWLLKRLLINFHQIAPIFKKERPSDKNPGC